jgi:hypothetical protein
MSGFHTVRIYNDTWERLKRLSGREHPGRFITEMICIEVGKREAAINGSRYIEEEKMIDEIEDEMKPEMDAIDRRLAETIEIDKTHGSRLTLMHSFNRSCYLCGIVMNENTDAFVASDPSNPPKLYTHYNCIFDWEEKFNIPHTRGKKRK